MSFVQNYLATAAWLKFALTECSPSAAVSSVDSTAFVAGDSRPWLPLKTAREFAGSHEVQRVAYFEFLRMSGLDLIASQEAQRVADHARTAGEYSHEMQESFFA